MNISAIIQARTSSTRFPQKVLKKLPLSGKYTVLEQVIRRVKKARMIKNIIIATTTDKDDDLIEKIAIKSHVKIFRGSKYDVLSRYYLAAQKNHVDLIVRITSDCPCVDPNIIDFLIKDHIKKKVDYTTNSLKREFPEGSDIEIINFSALELSHQQAKEDFEKEHVTPFIYFHPKKFKINSCSAPRKYYAPEIRITLDTEEDYGLLCAIYDFLYQKNQFFITEDIIKLYKKFPWLEFINNKVIQKKVKYSLKEELLEALKLCEYQGLVKAKKFLMKKII